jgi:hypothetical protein
MQRYCNTSLSVMNPIEFFRVITPDYITIFPKPDNILSTQRFFSGIYPKRYYFEYPKTHALKFQIHRKGTIAMQLYNCSTKELTTLTGIETNVTPVSYNSDYSVYNYTIVFNSEGKYKILFQTTYQGETESYESEVIKISESLQKSVLIEYYHDTNELGHAYTQNGNTIMFTGNIFPRAMLVISDSSSDSVGYDDDRGSRENLRATPKSIYDIRFEPLPGYFIDKLLLLFSCKYVTVNNIRIEKIGDLERERLPSSNMFACVQKVQVKDWDYMKLEFDNDFSLIQDDEDDFVSNDSDVLLTP